MSIALIKKTIHDGKWLLIACAAALFAFSWIRVLIVASIEVYRVQSIVRHLPDFVKRMAPIPIEEMLNYPSLIGFTFEEPLTYLIMAVWTISRASDCISGEIGRGTLEMILANPVGRLRYLIIHSTLTVFGIVILAGTAYGGTCVGVKTASIEGKRRASQVKVPVLGVKLGVPTSEFETFYTPMTQFVKLKVFVPATINYMCLGVFLAGLTTAISSWDRYRWRTIGITVGFYVVQTVIEVTGMAVEGWKWLLNLTFFSAYEPVEFVTQALVDPTSNWHFWKAESHGFIPDLGPLGCDIVLLSLGTLGFLIATVVFSRRDLPAPL